MQTAQDPERWPVRSEAPRPRVTEPMRYRATTTPCIRTPEALSILVRCRERAQHLCVPRSGDPHQRRRRRPLIAKPIAACAFALHRASALLTCALHRNRARHPRSPEA